jgi:nitric oxide reductase activation protein
MTADSTIHVDLQEMNTIFLFSAHNCGAKIKKIKQYAPIQTKVMMNQLQ